MSRDAPINTSWAAIRCPPESKTRWMAHAKTQGMSFSEWARYVLDDTATLEEEVAMELAGAPAGTRASQAQPGTESAGPFPPHPSPREP